jgi:hypothetical protein
LWQPVQYCSMSAPVSTPPLFAKTTGVESVAPASIMRVINRITFLPCNVD